jgi:hypothetical protein
VIVGEGSEAHALRAQVLSSSLPRGVFAGRREDICSLTTELCVAVLPAVREAQGISIREAMARRGPVVARQSAASSEHHRVRSNDRDAREPRRGTYSSRPYSLILAYRRRR